ncbi:hypothetical protein QYE76_056136 [Lolium multiflorum]|uniref:Uncharacterized protein n=1 Tax=Lolium multiflorum TaxID=4521 RepID=A0AAD8T120_LOLMU|nr:hypothetical protein QYE76_056136 [Lolium multiflorum]
MTKGSSIYLEKIIYCRSVGPPANDHSFPPSDGAAIAASSRRGSSSAVGRTAALHVNHGSNTSFVRTHCTHRRKVRRKQIRRPRRPGFVPRTNWYSLLARQADDPWYIAYQDESTQWCSQRMDLEEKVANLGDELARKNLMIFELKRIVEEEKKNSELIRKEKLRVETDLAVFDQVVENLEHELKVMGEEKSRFICAVLLGVIPVLAVMWFW